jgi:hypothetical protein
MRSAALAAAVMSLIACRHRVEIDPEVERLARAQLQCQEPLIAESVNFNRSDANADPHRWAEQQIHGCDRATWCGTPADRMVCRPPADLDLAMHQLAVETGCAPTAIRQLQRFAVNAQATYRLEACGRTFACTVPLVRFEDDPDLTPLPAIATHGALLLTCKGVEPAPAAAPASPPPPPPSN